MSRILSDFLNSEKTSPPKTLSPRRVVPTIQQFREPHSVSALDALTRNALAYERSQALASRPRTTRPVRTGHAVITRRAA